MPRSETPREPAPRSDGRSGFSCWHVLALCALSLWLIDRLVWIAARPAILGKDPYTRLYNRDELAVGLFGRTWMPMMQAFIKGVFELGGTADEVQVLMGFLSTGMILTAAYFLYRVAGPLEAFLYALLLSVNFNIMWISASPYQETLFYTFFFAVLLGIHKAVLSPSGGLWRPVVALVPWIVLAILSRYEGLLLSSAVAVAIAAHWWRDLEVRNPRHYLGLVALFIVVPVVAVPALTSVESAQSSLLVQKIEWEKIVATLDSLWVFLSEPKIFFWLCIGLVPLFQSKRKVVQWRPELIASALFLGAFILIFMIFSPFAPVTNSRFHVPIVFTIYAGAALGIPVVLRAVASSVSPARRRAQNMLFALLLLLHVTVTWRATSETMIRRYAVKLPEANIGRVLDRRIAPPTPILFARGRGDYFGHPHMGNMKIVAYVRGPASRVLFLEDYRALDEARRQRLLREVGGVLFEREHLGGEEIGELLALIARLHGDELTRTDLPRKTSLFTWNESARVPDDPLFPSVQVRVSELLHWSPSASSPE